MSFVKSLDLSPGFTCMCAMVIPAASALVIVFW